MNLDAQRFMQLTEKQNELKTKKIRIEEQCKAKEAELKKLVAEVKQAGYQPNELKKVIDEKSAKIEKAVAEFDSLLEEVSKELSSIEEGYDAI